MPPARGVAIKFQKINRLGNFRIGFRQRLAAVRERRAHQIAARHAQFLRDLAENFRTRGRRQFAPAVGIGGGGFHRSVYLGFAGLTVFSNDHAGPRRVKALAGSGTGILPLCFRWLALTLETHRRDTCATKNFLAINDEWNLRGLVAAERLPLGYDLLRPFTVLRQRKICVRLVLKLQERRRLARESRGCFVTRRRAARAPPAILCAARRGGCFFNSRE